MAKVIPTTMGLLKRGLIYSILYVNIANFMLLIITAAYMFKTIIIVLMDIVDTQV